MRKLILVLAFIFYCLNTLFAARQPSAPDTTTQKPAAAGTSQTTKPAPQSPVKNPVAPIVDEKFPPVEVTDVYRLGHERQDDSDRNSAGIGDIIVLKVNGLRGLFVRAYPFNGRKQEIRLFFGDREMTDMAPISSKPITENGEIAFKLERNENNDKIWSDLLGRPGFSQFFLRRTKISVGLDGSNAEYSSESKFHLVRIRQYWFFGGIVVLAVYFFFLISHSIKSCMLRDTPIDLSPLNLNNLKDPKPPYSLGKIQMAFWFSVILTSYIFIWLITGNYELLTAGSLGLVGIGAGCALGSVSIDNNKGQATIAQIQALQQQEASLVNDYHNLADLNPPGPTTAADMIFKQKAIDQTKAQIDQLVKGLTLHTNGFINDILTDVNGISFHRLQMFIWTIVLGLIFAYTVWASLTMPDFSGTLLALQGITAGTYLGFKFPEKQV
jgi:hypothetical protein